MIIVILVCVGFFIWGELIISPMEEAKLTKTTTDTYTFEDGRYLHYGPLDNDLDIGIIIYPGARVDAAAYGLIASGLAELGYDVYITKFLADFALIGINNADKIIENHQNKEWYISGHSLGGVAAAMYYDNHQDLLDGIVFFASYPSGNVDLSQTDAEVLSIYGEMDGLASLEEINEYKILLPDSTTYYMIEGGNHAYFGYYGEQNGDGVAEITREEQQAEIVGVMDEWLKK